LRETLREHLGLLSQKYVEAILTGVRESDMDRMYGVYLDKNGMIFGSKRFDVDKADNIIIDDMRYVGTPGLYELIFKRVPNDVIYGERQAKVQEHATDDECAQIQSRSARSYTRQQGIQVQTCNRAVDVDRT